MRAELDAIYSIDMEDGPPQLPDDPEHCWVIVNADIGSTGRGGIDNFEFVVATPSRLKDVLKEESHVMGRHMIIVDRFDWRIIEDAIRSVCHKAVGNTWEDVVQILSRYACWEYEDYQE